MATPAQLHANRRNALRSTGPRTPAGKARSSQNARRHGFRSRSPAPPPWDDPLFAHLLHNLRAELQPATPAEDDLLLQFAVAAHRLQALDHLEAEIFRAAPDPLTALQQTAKLHRHTGSAHVAFHRALRRLGALPQPKRSRGCPRKNLEFAPTNPIVPGHQPKKLEICTNEPNSRPSEGRQRLRQPICGVWGGLDGDLDPQPPGRGRGDRARWRRS